MSGNSVRDIQYASRTVGLTQPTGEKGTQAASVQHTDTQTHFSCTFCTYFTTCFFPVVEFGKRANGRVWGGGSVLQVIFADQVLWPHAEGAQQGGQCS